MFIYANQNGRRKRQTSERTKQEKNVLETFTAKKLATKLVYPSIAKAFKKNAANSVALKVNLNTPKQTLSAWNQHQKKK